MFCVGFTETYTMAVPLQVLRSLAADFDGYVIARRARKGQVCTPRNCWNVLILASLYEERKQKQVDELREG